MGMYHIIAMCTVKQISSDTTVQLTLYSKVVGISEVLLGQPRPLLGDLTHLLGTIRRQNLQCRHTHTHTHVHDSAHQIELSLINILFLGGRGWLV
jgi:hypothetical protein